MDEPGFTKLAEARVGIVGLGLMGGSLALALAGGCREIIGVETDSAARAFALDHAFVQRIADFETALQTADLLILATPVRTILSQLQKLTIDDRRQTTVVHRPSSVVLDLGSTKSSIAAAMRQLPPHFDPIGGHPMCGKEVSGIAHADPDLYRDKTFVLCPLDRTSPRTLALAHELVARLGAQALVLDAETHDIFAALISHLPYVASVALMRAALTVNSQALWQMAASGFRDTTRLAASDLMMMVDILLTNRVATREALAYYQTELEALGAAIDAGDAAALRVMLETAQRQRSEMFKSK